MLDFDTMGFLCKSESELLNHENQATRMIEDEE